jgi:hypothetical protein
MEKMLTKSRRTIYILDYIDWLGYNLTAVVKAVDT